jgi:hypothetical protein
MATNNAVNAPFPLSATQGGLGVASPTAHGILVGEGASAVNPIVLTNGQMLIGSTGVDPVATVISAGLGISVTTGAGTLTISAVAGGLGWTTVVGTSQAISVNNGYVANNAGLVTLTLPATASVGDEIVIMGKGAGGWTIAQNASQSIQFGNQTTTVGVAGSLSSTNQWDNVGLRCITSGASTLWSVADAVGNLTVV